MKSNKWMSASLLALLFALQSTASKAEPRIGVAASTRPNAEALSEGGTQALSAGSEIYASQTVRTGNFGMADLVFIDTTNLGVGPSSEVRLEKFVYDPTGVGGSVVMNATRGSFRFVTGSQAKHAYQVNTPHGSLGVRGTVVEVVVNPKKQPSESECVTKIRLVEGEATYDVAKTKKKARLTQPNQVACISPSGEISYSTSSTSILGFSAEQTPPPPSVIPGTGGVNPNPPPPPPCVSPTTPNCG
jgi:hypothetical protein